MNSNMVAGRSVDDLFIQAKRLIAVDMYDKAREIMKEAIALYPDQYKSYLIAIMIDTECFSKLNLTFSSQYIDTIEKLMDLDNVEEKEYSDWKERKLTHDKEYSEIFPVIQWNINLCNQMPPGVAFDILGCSDILKNYNSNYKRSYNRDRVFYSDLRAIIFTTMNSNRNKVGVNFHYYVTDKLMDGIQVYRDYSRSEVKNFVYNTEQDMSIKIEKLSLMAEKYKNLIYKNGKKYCLYCGKKRGIFAAGSERCDCMIHYYNIYQ